MFTASEAAPIPRIQIGFLERAFASQRWPELNTNFRRHWHNSRPHAAATQPAAQLGFRILGSKSCGFTPLR